MTEERFSNLHRNGADIMHNCRIKSYPDGSSELLIASSDIFREPGWELEDAGNRIRDSSREYDPVDSLARAKRRAAAAVHDLAMCNDFRWFVTLTLDQAQISRYDAAEVVRRLSTWADNRVRRCGLKYVLIPELHKDGAIHFHGFFNDALPMTDSGTIRCPGGKKPRRPRSAAMAADWLAAGGQRVYNCPAWKLGFSTAIELYGERRAAIGYTVKYITKASDKIGGRWYYSGGELRRPDVAFYDVDYADFSGAQKGHEFVIEALNVRVVKLTVGGGVDAD